eukprot:GHVT01075933.1.p1 GENE.GHVT01075933.1~~GHVT01075933.1.p1  ORF type:complete len:149 (+),score=19.81 GHVT01075933.1:768-1214(+)
MDQSHSSQLLAQPSVFGCVANQRQPANERHHEHSEHHKRHQQRGVARVHNEFDVFHVQAAHRVLVRVEATAVTHAERSARPFQNSPSTNEERNRTEQTRQLTTQLKLTKNTSGKRNNLHIIKKKLKLQYQQQQLQYQQLEYRQQEVQY